MTAAELDAWCQREAHRRRRARGGVLAWPPLVGHGLAGVLLAALVAARGGWSGGAAELAAAARPWLVAVIGVGVVLVAGAPLRLFWQPDSQRLARLPLAGRALYGLGLRRTARAALGLVALAGPALAVFATVDGAVAARGAALLGLTLAAALGAGPGLALLAGAVVASAKAREALGSLGGELQAAKTTWLGSLPAFGGTGLIVAGIALAPWLTGGAARAAPAAAWFVGGLGLAGALAGWAAWRCDAVMRDALREVSALDQDRLAHIDRVGPSRLERGFGQRAVAADARLVFAKDATLLRRRHPGPYVVAGLALAIAWLVAALGSPGAMTWAIALVIGLGAYVAIMTRRALRPPIEEARLLASLPIRPGAARAAKRSAALLRLLAWPLAAGAPLLGRGPLVLVGLGLAVALALGLGGSLLALRE